MITYEFLTTLDAKPVIKMGYVEKVLDSAVEYFFKDVSVNGIYKIYVNFVEEFDYDRPNYRTRGHVKFNKFVTGQYALVEIRSDLTWDVFCRVVFHEFAHIKQNMENRLIFSDIPGTIIWEGLLMKKTAPVDCFSSYQELPWEKEARSFEEVGKKVVLKSLGLLGYWKLQFDIMMGTLYG